MGLNCGNYMHKGFYQIRQRIREGLSRIKAVFVGCHKKKALVSSANRNPNSIVHQSKAYVNAESEIFL